MAKTIDLSGYPLASGSHSITVKACADGFDDSAASNAVTYQPSSGNSIYFPNDFSYFTIEYNGDIINDSLSNYPKTVLVPNNAQIEISIVLTGSGNDWYIYLNGEMVAGDPDASFGGSYTLTVTSDVTITESSPRTCYITTS